MDNSNSKISITALDLLTLIEGVKKAAETESVGFEDASRTLDQLLNELDKRVEIKQDVLESALWSCNLLYEQRMFLQTSRIKSFPAWVQSIIPVGYQFDNRYNLIRKELVPTNGRHRR